MDFSCVFSTEKILRPSCIPWELHGAETNGGTAAMRYVLYQGQKCNDVQNAPAAIHL